MMKAEPKIRILIVEDLVSDFELILKEMQRANLEFVARRVETEGEFLEELREFNPDLIISDYSLPMFDGMTALLLANKLAARIPFIVVTGSINEETAIECMKAGAVDYVLKDHLGRLGAAVQGALNLKSSTIKKEEAEEKLRQSEEQFRLISENAADLIQVLDLDGKQLYCSPSYFKFWSGRIPALLSSRPSERFQEALEAFQEVKKDGSPRITESCIRNEDGSFHYLESQYNLVRNQAGQPERLIVISRDITQRKLVEFELQNSLKKLHKTVEDTIQAMARIVEIRDPYTAGHQKRVAILAAAIAEEMDLAAERLAAVKMAGIIHDIGKIYVPSEILSKPGQLNPLEMAIIKTHPHIGCEILKTIDFPWPVADIVLQHHERLDGSGYEYGLQGEQIVLEAKIIGVADVVEAMASHRPYRPSLGIEKAIMEIRQNCGKLYDPAVVESCIKIITKPGFQFQP